MPKLPVCNRIHLSHFYANDGHRRGRNQSCTGVQHSISEFAAKCPCCKLKFGVRYARTALVPATPVASKIHVTSEDKKGRKLNTLTRGTCSKKLHPRCGVPLHLGSSLAHHLLRLLIGEPDLVLLEIVELELHERGVGFGKLLLYRSIVVALEGDGALF